MYVYVCVCIVCMWYVSACAQKSICMWYVCVCIVCMSMYLAFISMYCVLLCAELLVFLSSVYFFTVRFVFALCNLFLPVDAPGNGAMIPSRDQGQLSQDVWGGNSIYNRFRRWRVEQLGSNLSSAGPPLLTVLRTVVVKCFDESTLALHHVSSISSDLHLENQIDPAIPALFKWWSCAESATGPQKVHNNTAISAIRLANIKMHAHIMSIQAYKTIYRLIQKYHTYTFFWSKGYTYKHIHTLYIHIHTHTYSYIQSSEVVFARKTYHI